MIETLVETLLDILGESIHRGIARLFGTASTGAPAEPPAE